MMKKYIYKICLLYLVTTALVAQVAERELYLMPWPKEVNLQAGKFVLNKDFNLGIYGTFDNRIYAYANSFLRRLDGRTGLFLEQGVISKFSNFSATPDFRIEITSAGKIALHEDESYELTVSETGVLLKAVTDIGAMRGLETLLQLQSYSEEQYYFPNVTIKDVPRFPWRGLMIDVSRHFQPVHVLKRNLDAMAAVKMNVFHWHLSDDQGFRVAINKHPKLTNLGSDGNYYTQDQIKDVVAYAAARGIQVIPEIDVPGHASALLTAYPELASIDRTNTIERNAGIFNPTLDPTNKKTYKLLADIFDELADLFPSKYVHIGGDENEGKDWNNNDRIQKFMQKEGLKTNHDLQTYFNIKLQKILQRNNKIMIGWEEILTPEIPSAAIIHSWRGVNEGLPAKQSLVNAVKSKHQTILSNGYYLDLMYPIEEHYLVDPMPDVPLTEEEKNSVLGGEATMWSELVSEYSIDSRIWPRTIAIAERFWSQKNITSLASMRNRIGPVSNHLEELGLKHISYKNTVLRNLTNYQETRSLKLLTKIFEPLKGYTRNKGGLEYTMYSPLTLFADACTADAADKLAFKLAVKNAMNQSADNSRLLSFLDKWIKGYQEFEQLEPNPKLQLIKPVYKDLATAAAVIKELLLNRANTSKQSIVKLQECLQRLTSNELDVELMVLNDLQMLTDYLVTN